MEFLSAAHAGNQTMLQQLIEMRRDLVHIRDSNGFTGLSLAAEQGHREAVRVLLDAGAWVDTQTSTGNTPLMWSAARGHTDLAVMLLSRGADLLYLYISSYHHIIILYILLQIGADTWLANENGDTALMWAASQGHLNITQLVLTYMRKQDQANNDRHVEPLRQVTKRGMNAFAFSAAGGRVEVLRFFLADGALTAEELLSRFADKQGNSPLHHAAVHGRAEAVKMLLKNGADVTMTNRKGQTALALSKQTKDVETVRVLQERWDALSAERGAVAEALLAELEAADCAEKSTKAKKSKKSKNKKKSPSQLTPRSKSMMSHDSERSHYVAGGASESMNKADASVPGDDSAQNSDRFHQNVGSNVHIATGVEPDHCDVGSWSNIDETLVCSAETQNTRAKGKQPFEHDNKHIEMDGEEWTTVSKRRTPAVGSVQNRDKHDRRRRDKDGRKQSFADRHGSRKHEQRCESSGSSTKSCRGTGEHSSATKQTGSKWPHLRSKDATGSTAAQAADASASLASTSAGADCRPEPTTHLLSVAENCDNSDVDEPQFGYPKDEPEGTVAMSLEELRAAYKREKDRADRLQNDVSALDANWKQWSAQLQKSRMLDWMKLESLDLQVPHILGLQLGTLSAAQLDYLVVVHEVRPNRGHTFNISA
eukprot:SAG31_NODE_1658_length_7616_cov_2.929227_3_plen_653_part_00